MSFLNLALLGGIAAFMVPLLIHLLNRTKLQSIDWGAMHLLEAAMQVNTRRFQWESYLLLLLRCLIPALFAFGLARPVLTSLRSGAAQGDSSVLVVVDNSMSMLAPTQNDSVSRYANATDLANAVLRDQGKAQLSVWTAGSGYVNLVDGDTFNADLAVRELEQQTAGAGQFDVALLIGEATNQLSLMQNPNRQLVIISDFQHSQWGQLSPQQLTEIKQQLDNTIGEGQLTLLTVSDDQSVVANISVRLTNSAAIANDGANVDRREPELEPLFVGSPFRVQAVIHNWNAAPTGDVRVDLAIDGQILSSERITLSPESEQQVEFACSFDEPGSHTFSVALGSVDATSDLLAADNIAVGAVYVHPRIEVVIVDPDSANRADTAGKFIQLALASAGDQSGFQVRLVTRLDANDPLNCHALVWIGSQLDDRIADSIFQFVSRGGGLLVIPNEGLNAAHLNRLWFEQRSLLPAKYADRSISPADPIGLRLQRFESPLLQLFNDWQSSDLESVRSQRYWPLQIEAQDQPASSSSSGAGSNASGTIDQTRASVLSILNLTDASSVLAQRSVGQGSVLQWGVSPDAQWSNLASRAVFVPLIQRSIVSLLNEGPQMPVQQLVGRSSTVGRKWLSVNSQSHSDATTTTRLVASAEPNRWQLAGPLPTVASTAANAVASRTTTPVQIQLELEPVGSTLQLPSLRLPGLYELTPAVASTPPKAVARPIQLAVGLEPAESQLSSLSTKELADLANRLGAHVTRSAEDYHSSRHLRRDGQEIWRPLLIALVVVLFAEILLARRITRGVPA